MNKKKVATTAVAVGLAAILALGGTWAYYQDSSEKVTNTILPNYNSVTLDETDNEDSSERTTSNTYEIVPGTTDTKDPVATVNYTLDSYVYLVVDDATAKLIDFSIDTSVWTKLDGYDNVWYALVTADDADSYTNATTSSGTSDVIVYTKKLNVLTDETISYSSSITNEQMFDSEGYLIDDLTLEFQAYIIQATLSDSADPAEPATAYQVLMTGSSYYYAGATYVALDADTTSADLATQLTTAISSAEAGTTTVIVLPESSDITVNATALNAVFTSDTDIVIDLNDNTLTVEQSDQTLVIADSSKVTIANGDLSKEKTSGYQNFSIDVYANATFTLENVEYVGGVIGTDSTAQNAKINIINSTITSQGYYAISTNAGSSVTGVEINVENSTLTTSLAGTDPETTGILFNVPGTLNIKSSTITGGSQGVIVRGGTANISDSVITALITENGALSSFSTTMGYLDGTSDWKTGNSLPAAALVAGNHSSGAYKYDTTVTLSNVKLVVGGETDAVPALYVASSGYNTTVTGASASDTVLAYMGENGSISVNETSVESTITTLATVGELGAD